jgi:hypothetical protein
MPHEADELPWLTLLGLAALIVFGLSIMIAFLR